MLGDFIEIDLTDEQAETLRLLCRATSEDRDSILAAAIEAYCSAHTRDADVVPMRLVREHESS